MVILLLVLLYGNITVTKFDKYQILKYGDLEIEFSFCFRGLRLKDGGSEGLRVGHGMTLE